ncbi:MAG: uridine kinase [Oligoflexia bacterium]|nr:uridine kinase [Oligoflexia bacterium]
MPKIIAIAGASGSGKTTLAQELRATLSAARAALISFDSYYRPLTHLSWEERARVNFDHPDSLEVSLLEQQLMMLKQGQAIDVPSYDFSQHDRIGSSRLIEPRQYVIVEGILALSFPKLRPVYSLAVFVDTPQHICYQRRLARDVSDRGRTPESVKLQWNESVEPMFKQYCAPSKSYAELVCCGLSDVKLGVKRILERL